MLLLFEYGVEGGGAEVYQLTDNTVVEKGSSGGILDDEEDPIKTWEKEFESFDHFWQHFVKDQPNHWFYFYPVFIHPTIVATINPFIKTVPSTIEPFHKENWLRKMNGEL